MAVKVVRVYGPQARTVDDIEHYMFSIIATESGAEYLFPTGYEVEGFDAKRIEMNERRLSSLSIDTDTPEGWLQIAKYNLRMLVLPLEEDYETLRQARDGETRYAAEAVPFIEDFNNLDDPAEIDGLEVEDEAERGENLAEAKRGLYSYYALVSDDDEVVAAFRVKNGVEELRTSYGWGGQSYDQDEEWDGYSQITMEEEFIQFYDRMIADKKDVTLNDVKKFRRKES